MALSTSSGVAPAISGGKSAVFASAGSDKGAIARRLQSELMAIMMSGNKLVSAFPNGDNLFEWIATISGSPGTAYEGLTYKLRIVFPGDFPFTAPTVTFITPCFHPNVSTAGDICVDFLKDRWSAALSVSALLLSLQSLLADPNTASPLNGTAAALWDSNPVEYRKTLLKKYREAGGVAPDA